MKNNIKEFIHRGMIAGGFGPIVLAFLYFILQKCGVVQMLPVNEVCCGIISISVLAFVAGGLNVLYGIERLPLMSAILIHGGVLYLAYLATYLINGWLQRGKTPILVFSGIFVLGYLVIWLIVYFVTQSRTKKLNEKLKQTQYTDK